MAVKLLICGFENSAKSTITSKIKNGMVVNFDRKEYGFEVPHVNVGTFTMENTPDCVANTVISLINEKLGVYLDKMGKMPESIVLDTVTQYYSGMAAYNGMRYKNFDIHSNNNADTLNFNNYVEDVLIANGINVIIVAHTIYDEQTARHLIPAAGKFKDAGSWLSVVNDAIFIEKKSNKLVAHQKSLKYPCRSTLATIEASLPVPDAEAEPKKGEYDINVHIKNLTDSKVEATKFVL